MRALKPSEYLNALHHRLQGRFRRAGGMARSIPVVLLAVVLGCGLLQTSRARAQELQPGDIELKRGETRTWKFAAPTVGRGQVAVLDFQARYWGKGLTQGTSAYLLQVDVNDHPVRAMTDRVQPSHLRNKAPASKGLAWCRNQHGWRIVAAPDFSGPPTGTEAGEDFHFVVEIGEYLHPGENVLTVDNKVGFGQTLTLREIKIYPMTAQPAVRSLRVREGARAVLNVRADGSLAIQADNTTFAVCSSFSVPGGGWLRLGPPSRGPAPEQNTKPTVSRTRPGEYRVLFGTPFYRVERLVRVSDGRFSVADNITNRTSTDLGLMIRHELLLPGKAGTVRLGGDDEPAALQTVMPTNPTIYIPLGGLGLGLVVEDEVLRNQGILLYNGQAATASIRTERLVLPPGETVALRWSTYALPGSDYFDLVNRIRADWGVRVRLDGPYWWNVMRTVDHSDEELRSFLTRNHVYAAVIGSWLDFRKKEKPPVVGLGVGALDPYFADYRMLLRKTVARIRQLSPRTRVGVYEHYFFNWPQAEEEQFRDSWIIGKDSKVYVERWGGVYSPSVGVFPTPTNSFGTAFRRALDRQVEELGVDGFYFDETDGPGRLHDPITYGTWDGRSGILDPKTFAVEKKIGYLDLLSSRYRTTLMKDLRERGLWVLGNDQPHTPAGNRDSWPRFTETDSLQACYHAHLYSPLAFTYYGESYTVKTLRERLDLGVVCCTTGPKDCLGIVGKFFPITPTSLHRGRVEGEERVITSQSGSFGWSGSYRARVWAYRADGSPVEASPSWQAADGLVRVEVPAGGIAILERSP